LQVPATCCVNYFPLILSSSVSAPWKPRPKGTVHLPLTFCRRQGFFVSRKARCQLYRIIDRTRFMACRHSGTAAEHQPLVKTIEEQQGKTWWAHLPRIHESERVNRALDGLHELDRTFA